MTKVNVMAITESNTYAQIKIGDMEITLAQAEQLAIDLDEQLEILHWEEMKKQKTNPEPFESESEYLERTLGLSPAAKYNW